MLQFDPSEITSILAHWLGLGVIVVLPSMVCAEVVLMLTAPAPIILMLNISPEIPTAVGNVIVQALAQFAMTTVVVEVSVKFPVMAVVEIKRALTLTLPAVTLYVMPTPPAPVTVTLDVAVIA